MITFVLMATLYDEKLYASFKVIFSRCRLAPEPLQLSNSLIVSIDSQFLFSYVIMIDFENNFTYFSTLDS